jgi:hypothetical protein
MKILILFSSFMVLSTSTLANKYDWTYIQPPSVNFYSYSQGNQQIQNGLNTMVDALVNYGNKKQNNSTTSYHNTGSFTYGSDGSSSYNTEDRSYVSNGNTYYQMNENNGYDSNGSIYNSVGDYLYITQPDGRKFVCYYSNVDTQCREN